MMEPSTIAGAIVGTILAKLLPAVVLSSLLVKLALFFFLTFAAWAGLFLYYGLLWHLS
jgi:hypothetical protein